MTPIEILLGASRLLKRTGCWTQGWEARRQDGSTCKPDDRLATSWSSDGALAYIGRNDPDALKAARKALYFVVGSIHCWNDEPGQSAEDVAYRLRFAARTLGWEQPARADAPRRRVAA